MRCNTDSILKSTHSWDSQHKKKLVGFCIVEQKSTIFLPPQSTFEKIASINSVAIIGNFPVFTSFIEKMEINRIYPLEIAEI